MFASIVIFSSVVLGTILSSRWQEAVMPLAEALSSPGRTRGILDRWWLWVAIAIVIVLMAYAEPIIGLIQTQAFGSPGFKLC